jgi:hypothetical protein
MFVLYFLALLCIYPCVFCSGKHYTMICSLLCIFLMICILFREYVAQLQKKDPKLYSLYPSFCKQQHQDEHQNLLPISATKFRRWNCSDCLDKVKITDRTTSIDVSLKQNDTSSGCSISFIRNVMPTSVDYTRRLPCTPRLSQGNQVGGSALPKSTQECNSNCKSPGSKGVLTEMNIDLATKGMVEIDKSSSKFLYIQYPNTIYSQSHRRRPIFLT